MVNNMNQFIAELRDSGVIQYIKRERIELDIQSAISAVSAIGSAIVPEFRIDDDNRFVFENLIRWIHADPSCECHDASSGKRIKARLNAGLYICGPTGTGKSVALNVIMPSARFIGARIIIQNHRRTHNPVMPLSTYPVRSDLITDEFVAMGSIGRWKTAEILAIQDLGSEPKLSNYMGNQLNVMKSIIEYRGDRSDMISCFTSNLSLAANGGKQVSEEYEDRVSSRLRQMCNVYILKGKDRRI